MAENQALKTFIIYARDDKAYKDQLLRHLRPLVSSGYLNVWHDGDIMPGEDWEKKIKTNLKTSQLVLVLVSVNCLNSDFIEGAELETAVSQLRDGHTRIVPIIISPCGWRFHKLFVGLQGLPEDMKPVSAWSDPHEAWTDVVESLAKIVEDSRAEQAATIQKQYEAAEQQRLAVIAAEHEAQQKAAQAEREHLEREQREREAAERKRLAENAAADLAAKKEVTRLAEEAKKQRLADLTAQNAEDLAAIVRRKKEAEGLRREQEAERKRQRQEAQNGDSGNTSTLWIGFGTVVALMLVLIVWKPWKGKERVEKEVPAKTTSTTTTAVPDNMVLVRGGTFTMGDQFNEGSTDEKPTHSVALSDFYIGKYEVTFDEFDAFCAATGREKPSDNSWGRGRRPVINVDWYDAVEYCNWRSQKENLALVYRIDKTRLYPNNQNSRDTKSWTVSMNLYANGYRLPTEAEWEYAAREGGKKVRFGNGRDIIEPSEINFDASAYYKKDYSVVGKYRNKTVLVDDLSANSLGLKHMSGNVWEWCFDWYGEKFYTESDGARNPTGSTSGTWRVLRGGSWSGYPESCRVALRGWVNPLDRFDLIGFRVVRGYSTLSLLNFYPFNF